MADWPYSTRQWQRLRRHKLQETPLCELCPRVMPATQVDHVVPVSAGGDPFPALSGLRSLCARCHGKVTRGVACVAIDPNTGRPFDASAQKISQG